MNHSFIRSKPAILLVAVLALSILLSLFNPGPSTAAPLAPQTPDWAQARPRHHHHRQQRHRPR